MASDVAKYEVISTIVGQNSRRDIGLHHKVAGSLILLWTDEPNLEALHLRNAHV